MRAILYFLLIFVSNIYAQQGILISNYHDQKMMFNPAAVGISDNLEVVGAYRNQWGGIQDNPKNYLLSLSSFWNHLPQSIKAIQLRIRFFLTNVCINFHDKR